MAAWKRNESSPGGPGERAGLKAGDLLIAANGATTPRWASLTYQMIQAKVYSTITYTILRDGIRLEVPVILEAPDRSFNQGFRLIALVYLLIGLYVLFRRWTAPSDTFLRFLPAFLRSLRLQLHGQIQQLRLDHLLGQDRCRRAAAGTFPALRACFS